MPAPAALAAAVAALLAAAPSPDGPGRTVGILVMDGLYDTELVGPLDVFDHAGFRVVTIAPRPGLIRTAEGLRILPDHHFGDHPPLDVLVVPSFEAYEAHLEDAALIGWIRDRGREAEWVTSHCWGAFYLAAAGLLDGRRATTYPPDVDALARRFPKLRAERGVRFVRDGPVVTSAGGVASFEAPLFLVRKLGGDEAARKVARGLVIDDPLQTRLRYVDVGPLPRRRPVGPTPPGAPPSTPASAPASGPASRPSSRPSSRPGP